MESSTRRSTRSCVRRRRTHEREHEGTEARVVHGELLEEWMDIDTSEDPARVLHALDEIEDVDDLSDLDAENVAEQLGEKVDVDFEGRDVGEEDE